MEERPSFRKLLLYAIQRVGVMFPATVTGCPCHRFQVSTTIFASGLASLCFILITGREDPAVLWLQLRLPDRHRQHVRGRRLYEGRRYSAYEAIQYAQFGIIFSGLISIAAGLLIPSSARKVVELSCPPPSLDRLP